jgi:hypothetical protein
MFISDTKVPLSHEIYVLTITLRYNKFLLHGMRCELTGLLSSIIRTRCCALSPVYFCRSCATCKYNLLCIILCLIIYGNSVCAILFRNYLINGIIFEYIYIYIYISKHVFHVIYIYIYIWHETRVFIFSVTLLYENIVFPGGILGHIIINVLRFVYFVWF